jgi:hypothetical protein
MDTLRDKRYLEDLVTRNAAPWIHDDIRMYAAPEFHHSLRPPSEIRVSEKWGAPASAGCGQAAAV